MLANVLRLIIYKEKKLKDSKVLLIRLNKDSLLSVEGGVIIKVQIQNKDCCVFVEDDLGEKVEHRTAELNQLL